MLEKELLQLAQTAPTLNPKTLQLALITLAKQAAVTDAQSQKWVALGEEIHEIYSVEDDEDDMLGLISIGESAAIAYGYLD